MHEFELVAIGRAFTDIVADVDTLFLKRNNLIKGRGIETTPDLLYHIRSQLERYALQPGGSPSNTAAGIGALGGSAVFFGKVCDDAQGRAFRNAFVQGNVMFPTADYPYEPGAISATCLVLTSEDDTVTMAYNRGVSDRLTKADIVTDIIAASWVLLIQGHMAVSPESREAVDYAMKTAQHANRKTAITLNDLYAPADQTGFLAQADIIFGNLREFKHAFPGKTFGDFQHDEKIFIITEGERGANIVGHGHNMLIPPVELVPSATTAIPSFVGAGDQFAAGFLYGYANKFSFERCAKLGSDTAAAVMRAAGARPRGDWKSLVTKHLSADDTDKGSLVSSAGAR